MLLPDSDKIVSLDQRRDIVISMAENIERAAAPQRRALVELLVERVGVADRRLDRIAWTPAAREFLTTPSGASEDVAGAG